MARRTCNGGAAHTQWAPREHHRYSVYILGRTYMKVSWKGNVEPSVHAMLRASESSVEANCYYQPAAVSLRPLLDDAADIRKSKSRETSVLLSSARCALARMM